MTPDEWRKLWAQPARMTPHREPEDGDTPLRCATCGRLEVKFTEDEAWLYAVTGIGATEWCPRPLRRHLAHRCKWEPAPA